jgi:hypothetical protein
LRIERAGGFEIISELLIYGAPKRIDLNGFPSFR